MILITGASGFIGRNLAISLYKQGENVLASGRKEDDDFFSKNGIEYVKLDFSNSLDYLNIEKKDIKKIVHLGAIVPTNKFEYGCDEYISINGNGIRLLLNYSVKNNVEKFVNISSLTVYGLSGKNGIDESASLQPFGTYANYAIAKILSELYTKSYATDHQLNTVILRLGYVFGDYTKQHLLLPRLLKKALNGDEIAIEGTGEYIFDLLYIDDCINAIKLALNTSNNGIYNIGGGEAVTLNQVVDEIADYVYNVIQKPISVMHNPSNDTKTGYVMGLEKASKFLDYYPKYKGVEVIKRVLMDYKN